MLGFKVLNLKTDKGKNFYYNNIVTNRLGKEIENILDKVKDIDAIKELTSSLEYEVGKEKTNLANGYYYILDSKPINKDTLKGLYDILSKDLLDDYSIETMGKYYRKNNVYILDSKENLMGTFDKGMSPDKVEENMDSLFNYINKNSSNDPIELFIKSQIIHYYMAYVHPYYDVNGRCARTTSMWYLLNNGQYTSIVFNKGIYKNKTEYKKLMQKCRNGNLTPFLEFSLEVLKNELENSIIYSDEDIKKR